VGTMGFIVLDMMHLDILEECFLYNSSCTNGTYKNIKKNYRYTQQIHFVSEIYKHCSISLFHFSFLDACHVITCHQHRKESRTTMKVLHSYLFKNILSDYLSYNPSKSPMFPFLDLPWPLRDQVEKTYLMTFPSLISSK
jgi:hypothetical protein